MEYTEITDKIFQIADDDGVYCTLIKGSESAVLFDTGYGKQKLREFVEENITTGYIVINSHGHVDHISGNSQFDEIYAAENEINFIREIHRHFTNKEPEYDLKKLDIGQIIDMGDIQAEVIPLTGHTRGSIGLLLENERILLASDAFNPCLWMFTPGAASFDELKNTLINTDKLAFDSYIFGHSDEMLPHDMLKTILKNAENIKLDPESKEIIMGIETYKSVYRDENGESVIVYRKDQICCRTN